MKNDFERFDKWKEDKRQQGWKYFNVFVPSELADLLRRQMRQWKYENPQHYKRG
jgi:hypothetical protein